MPATWRPGTVEGRGGTDGWCLSANRPLKRHGCPVGDVRSRGGPVVARAVVPALSGAYRRLRGQAAHTLRRAWRVDSGAGYGGGLTRAGIGKRENREPQRCRYTDEREEAMKPKLARVRVLCGVLLVGSGTLQADNNNPSIEACAGYAKADTAYEAALQQVRAASDAAEAALQQVRAAKETAGQQAAAAYEAVMQQVVAYEAAEQQAEAAFHEFAGPAKLAWDAAYSASYDLDGWPRSDDQAVMVKLEKHHRQRCREIHGL